MPSDTGTIDPKWNWCDCYQVKMARLFPSNTGTIIPSWHWHNCLQVRLAQLFPSYTGTIALKWHWHDCSQVTLAWLFPSDTGTIVPKWHWHHCCQVDFDFLICILFCSLFFGMILHYWVSLGKSCAMYQSYSAWSSLGFCPRPLVFNYLLVIALHQPVTKFRIV